MVIQKQWGVPACPLCGAAQFRSYRFGLLLCAVCGFVMDQRIFTPRLDRQLNEEAFGEAYEPQRSFWVRWFEAWKNRRYLANLRRAGVKGGRLLEIGVGSGGFLQAARVAGFEPMGCELSRSLAQRVAARTGLPVHCGDLASLPTRGFDVVCMHHVLEHVSDPVGFLRAVRERLAPDGRLHVAVPNIGCWEARLPGWNNYVYYHLAYFDRDSLTRALTAAGFVVGSVSTHESFSGWFLALARTVAGVRSMQPPPQAAATDLAPEPRWRPLVEHPYRLAMLTTGLLIWPLRLLQGRLDYGDELIAVARAEA